MRAKPGLGRTKSVLLREIEERRGRVLCPGCERDVPPERLTKHHLRPRSRGGPTVLENLVLVCRPCHDDLHRPGASVARKRLREFLKGREVPGAFPPPPEPMDAAEGIRLFLCRMSAQAVRAASRSRFIRNPPFDPHWRVGRHFVSGEEPLRRLACLGMKPVEARMTGRIGQHR